VPAFILGNGPRLPVEHLSLLDGFFTVGTNRIIQVYDPTVHLVVDASAWPARMPDTKCQPLLSPLMNLKKIPGAWYPFLHIASEEWSKHPGELHADGNSGVCAAGWANSLGCEPIYLLGMTAKYRGKQTDFYGVNEFHKDGTVLGMQKALNNLFEHLPHCVPVANGDHLTAIVETEKKHKHDRNYWMDKLNGNLSV